MSRTSTKKKQESSTSYSKSEYLPHEDISMEDSDSEIPQEDQEKEGGEEETKKISKRPSLKYNGKIWEDDDNDRDYDPHNDSDEGADETIEEDGDDNLSNNVFINH